MNGLFKHIGNRAWFARVLSYSKPPVLEHAHKKKNSMSCVITASAHTNDHAQIRLCTLWVCKQQDYAVHSR